jgi:hypothetical protein
MSTANQVHPAVKHKPLQQLYRIPKAPEQTGMQHVGDCGPADSIHLFLWLSSNVKLAQVHNYQYLFWGIWKKAYSV